MKNTYKLLRPVMTTFMKALFHPTIEHAEEVPEHEKIILAGNHYSNFDPLLLATATKTPIHFLAKEELFRGPLKLLMQNIESIPVNRDGKDIQCINKAVSCLNNNNCVGIFPEGTTKGKDDTFILPFKLGTIIIAKRSKADIIPFAITGDYKLVKNNLRISFGNRIKTNDYSSKELLEKLETDVKTLMLKK